MKLQVAPYNNGATTWTEAEETAIISYKITHRLGSPAEAEIILSDPTGVIARKYNVDANDVFVGPGKITIEDPTATDIFFGRIMRAEANTDARTVNHRQGDAGHAQGLGLSVLRPAGLVLDNSVPRETIRATHCNHRQYTSHRAPWGLEHSEASQYAMDLGTQGLVCRISLRSYGTPDPGRGLKSRVAASAPSLRSRAEAATKSVYTTTVDGELRSN